MPVAATAAVPPGTMAGLEPVLEQDAAAPRDDGHLHATAATDAGAAGRSALDALGAGRAATVAATTVARPTMAELREVLAKHAAGNLTFDDVVPLLPHDDREVVGWLYMETGA